MHGDLHDVLKIAAGALIALTIRGMFIFAFEIVQELTGDQNVVKFARWIIAFALLAGAAVIWLALSPQ